MLMKIATLLYRTQKCIFSLRNSLMWYAASGYKNVVLYSAADCNCNWGTCIAPFTRRPMAHHRVNPYPGAHKQNQTEMLSDHDETNPSIAAVSAPSVACSMLAVQQQKRLCRQFVDVFVSRRGCHTMKCNSVEVLLVVEDISVLLSIAAPCDCYFWSAL